ncbi:hypothetical protein [Agromyces silvae]|uniref:hypothetical protein n=1 Tax=Agromyces silvae TaxID=3388266 RepID=UPI00280A97AC|nr:hypothetical protein [Agromyces protaetiae]
MRKIIMATALSFALLTVGVPTAASASDAAPSPSAGSYDAYSEVVFDDTIEWADGQAWSGTCKDGYWLDKRAGTPGKSMGQGFTATGQLYALTLVEYPWRRVKDGSSVKGSGGDVTNISPLFDEHYLKITMSCTNDPAYAWVP